jgi:hypothetical protein
MSARYDRKPITPSRHTPAEKISDPDLAPADHRSAWDALDRGDDPTG